jgi:hypothetical protein
MRFRVENVSLKYISIIDLKSLSYTKFGGSNPPSAGTEGRKQQNKNKNKNINVRKLN